MNLCHQFDKETVWGIPEGLAHRIARTVLPHVDRVEFWRAASAHYAFPALMERVLWKKDDSAAALAILVTDTLLASVCTVQAEAEPDGNLYECSVILAGIRFDIFDYLSDRDRRVITNRVREVAA